jgi:hypothetical protein
VPEAPGHEVRLDDGRFTTAHCSCGWQSAGRRNRATARAEARDHALLYADGSVLSAGSTPSADPAPAPVPAPVEVPLRDAKDRADA